MTEADRGSGYPTDSPLESATARRRVGRVGGDSLLRVVSHGGGKPEMGQGMVVSGRWWLPDDVPLSLDAFRDGELFPKRKSRRRGVATVTCRI